MNKLVTVVCLIFLTMTTTCYAGSAIDIPIPASNSIAPNAAMEINLDSLINDIPYMITCSLESSSPNPLDMRFSPSLAPNGGYGVAKVNDKPLMKEIGTLQNGQNKFAFMVSVLANKTKPNKMILKNLDNRFSVSVKTCQAQPVSNVTAAPNRIAGGYFYLTNYLPYYLDVNVGSYFPTSFCIPPHSKVFISVSTAYQDIDVMGTHY